MRRPRITNRIAEGLVLIRIEPPTILSVKSLRRWIEAADWIDRALKFREFNRKRSKERMSK